MRLLQRGLTIRIKHPPELDRHGDPIPASAAADTLVEGCLVAPRAGVGGSVETTDLQNLIDTHLVLYAPAGTVLDSRAAVVIPGYPGEWQVDGEANRWDLAGVAGQGGVEVALNRVTG